MKKILFVTHLFVSIALLTGCKHHGEEELSPPPERVLGEDDIPPFKNEEAEEYYFKGNDYRKTNDMIQAKECFLKAYQLDPSHILNMNNLASSYLYLHEYDKAEYYYKKALETDPTAEITYVNYLNYTIVSRELKKGVDFGRQALKRLKNERMLVMAQLNLALIHEHLHECDSAMFFFRQASELKDYVESTTLKSVEDELDSNCN